MKSLVKEFKTESGLKALILFIDNSHHCGYVAVEKNHFLYGVDSVDIDRLVDNVHGGLTFSGKKTYGLVDDNLWWFGFDCAHHGDKTSYFDGIFRDSDFVEYECESMANQISNITNEILIKKITSK